MLNSICGFLVVIPIYLIALIFAKKNKLSLVRHFILLIFFCYLGATVAVTLFPFPYDSVLIEMNRNSNYFHNNFIPFKSIYMLIKNDSLSVIVRNILGNVLLAMPLGFLLPLFSDKARNVKRIFLIGIGFSLIIEMSQFVLSLYLGYTYKITDVDDLILNTIGALMGYIAYKLICIIKEK